MSDDRAEIERWMAVHAIEWPTTYTSNEEQR